MLVKSSSKFQSNRQREGRKKIGKEGGREREGARERERGKERQRENGDMGKSRLETINFGCYFIINSTIN